MRLQAQALLQAAGEQLDAGAEQVWDDADQQFIEQPGGQAVAGQAAAPDQPDPLAAASG